MLCFETHMPETLAQYVSRTMREKRLSGYEIERITKRKITQSYVNRIKNGAVKNPSATKLAALALGLGEPAEDIFRIVQGRNGRETNFEKALQAAFFDADKWTDADRREAISFVRSYAETVRTRKRK
jgi:transcriptional regulator with XRE-family HTH domain